ncbi:putative DNA methyltransferase (fragment) [uncultured Alphaproteobacteria bacterium]|uniref:Putative DNA methyltransferase n=1 Tax=uncultured Alphaproteobacteria bacterium TaxID=91750 RepID=A0A212K016_9PROT
MRADLRRDTDEIWVINCSPEGHQPPVASRIFQGVQQPVCIVLASRGATCTEDAPAHVRFRDLPVGRREDKFAALAALSLDDAEWVDCPAGWRAPFLPAAADMWESYPSLDDLFVYNGSGVMPGRTWVIAPDAESLRARWDRLIKEKDAGRKELLFHPHLRNGKPGDKHSNKLVPEGLHGHPHRTVRVAEDQETVVPPVRYGFRSFDRQWIIPDSRLLNQPNPTLWEVLSKSQVYLTALARCAPSSGAALSFSGCIPDLDHYKGSFGGRVYPLWGDNKAEQSNVRPGLLTALTKRYGMPVSGEDVMAYIAAVAAHPGYVAQFSGDLIQPGLRIPITADTTLFAEAVNIGREVIWLHTFGERYADPAASRPAGPPRLPKGDGPLIPAGGEIPSDPEKFPDSISYDARQKRLHVGTGYIDNVPPAVWAYEVSGKPVLEHWFSYRRLDRSRPIIGNRRPPSPLGDIQPKAWLAEYTTELLNVIHVLGRLIALESVQADLLERICSSPPLTKSSLDDEKAFELPSKGKKPKNKAQLTLL